MLAKGVDSTFDWETDVDELHQRILLAAGAEPLALRPEQRLWKAWARAQRQMLESSDKLYDEAVASTSVDVCNPSPHLYTRHRCLMIESSLFSAIPRCRFGCHPFAGFVTGMAIGVG